MRRKVTALFHLLVFSAVAATAQVHYFACVSECESYAERPICSTLSQNNCCASTAPEDCCEELPAIDEDYVAPDLQRIPDQPVAAFLPGGTLQSSHGGMIFLEVVFYASLDPPPIARRDFLLHIQKFTV